MIQRTRRELIREGMAAMALASVPGCASLPSAPRRLLWRNWAGDHECLPVARVAPRDEDELVAFLRGTRGEVRPVGSGHSFTPIAATEGTLVSLDRMHGVSAVDAKDRMAEIWAGTRLHALGAALGRHDQLLTVQPDIDDQALAGALATSTHGTGPRFGSMSAYVDALTLVTPSGERVVCDRDRDSEVFHAARCSVGALGITSQVRMRNTAPMNVIERTWTAPVEDVLAQAETLAAEHMHMEFMPMPRSGLSLVMTTDPTDMPEVDLHEDPTSVEQLRAAWHAVGGDPEIYRAVVWEALGEGASDFRTGPAFLVRAHARYTRFREMEYTVPAAAGVACVREILDAIDRAELPLVFPIEVRYVREDDIWLSMFEGRAGCTISIHQFADAGPHAAFDLIEPILKRYEGRPHWGKMHTQTAAELRERYPRWDDFQRVRQALDPQGRMLNPWLERTLVAESAG